ncbi:hypothetical protein V2H45_03240 [Tumidithrix elongata RA019]|uniref:O-GlcNAc transferase C-terminal domain-containing protein n=1 Tax=Tumidithrix elongata BACA0141 TaxID=2716417 RepID=A0AAW9PUE8_9CYAN|nr:hypothetical protein [Tumidithrix elongata RA019]
MNSSDSGNLLGRLFNNSQISPPNGSSHHSSIQETGLQINPRRWLNLYLIQDYDALSEQFISILTHFEGITYTTLDTESLYFINAFLKNFLYLFTQPDFVIGDRFVARFIQLNLTISNLVAISDFKTTDAYLEILKSQPQNFVKLLTLYSARNSFKFDRKLLFDTNSPLACLWYSYFLEIYRSGLANKIVYQNLREHLAFNDDRIIDFYKIEDVYLATTYIDGDRDRAIKQKLNQSIQASPFCQNANIQNSKILKAERLNQSTLTPRKIAIITGFWFPSHSSYRMLSQFISSLALDYELTLFHLGEPRDDLDTSNFKEVKYITYRNGTLDISPLQSNDFAIAYYPDVGTLPASILLSNLRIAPMQICGLGHPVSTFGSNIDYFVSSAEAEAIKNPENHYSERLVLLPGFGVIPTCPEYKIQGIKKTRSEIIINCAWNPQKVNYPLLLLLGKIIKDAKQEVLFRFFASDSLFQKNDFLPFAKDLELALGKDKIELYLHKPYEQYMALMEEGDLCIDSYHFGGFNSLIDSLYLRKLTVTLEGKKWYNRVGARLIRLLGLPELVAKTPAEYTQIILKLINQEPLRLDLQMKMAKVDLDRTLFATSDRQDLKKTIDFLIENHDRLQSNRDKKPIRII